MSLWIVAYGVRSEAATAIVVEADTEQQAKERAVDIEREHDSFIAPYVESALALGPAHADVVVAPVVAGMRFDISAEH